ncbi:outer membrane lipoprotein-sorting protein [Zobellia uliginosa]|uniref:outer membrane lipoprotein-sorting protein n=1 Tax=Zobellia uliginosa TaxID=143224 RepID=UPI001C064B78|nr:outer membrane lipoprotein-sorting protein [Zobellia uliginosa]MBU2947337.1 outer membrane lipoprotein-sorting protein [Zobellia uliginosa]
MKLFISGLLMSSVILMSSCSEQPKAKKEVVDTTSQEATDSYVIPESWVNNRVAKAKSRLQANDAGKIVWEAMEAHGGLKNWYGNGALSFRFKYVPLDGSTVRDSYEVVDAWRNKAVHTSVTDSTATFGWDGETAWVKAKDSSAFAYDTKFWALTPLYLMGHPFILDGEGVELELLTEATYKDKANDVVKVTFAAGTGDAPDDYYILQFDKESHLLTATRYIVSYPEYFKEGGHNPEKFMEVGELIDVSGVLLPKELKTHWTTKEGKQGEYITQIDISDIHFVKDIDDDFFSPPENATIK